MSDPLSQLLASRDWLMADGATGTNLFNMGLQSNVAPELWNADQPDHVRRLYRDAVESGADLFLTNTFGGNASRLRLHSAESRVRELNRVAAELGAPAGHGVRHHLPTSPTHPGARSSSPAISVPRARSWPPWAACPMPARSRCSMNRPAR